MYVVVGYPVQIHFNGDVYYGKKEYCGLELQCFRSSSNAQITLLNVMEGIEAKWTLQMKIKVMMYLS